MKQLLILLLSTSMAFAQQNVVNGDFEDTIILHNQSEQDTSARHWTFSSFGAGMTDDAYTGTSAAYIWNWYYYAHGELTNGAASFSEGGGTHIDFMPTRLTGFYKYIPGDVDTENDSAMAIVCLTKYNSATSRRDTVGYGLQKLTFVSDYTAFNVDIEYEGGATPDTVTVKFVSSINGFCASAGGGNCLFLYVDDVVLKDTETGIGESVDFNNKLSLFPNPAQEFLQVNTASLSNEAISIYNVSGEKVLEQQITSSNTVTTILIGALPSGVYLVRAGETTGRFVKE